MVPLPRELPSQKVVGIGLDSAEWWYIAQLMSEGRLPHLAELARRADRYQLTALRAYRAEAIWTQFLTGRAPGQTGYWTNVAFDPASYSVWDRGASLLPPFWNSLGRDLRTIVIDVPHSSVSDSDDPMVVGWGSHSPQAPRSATPVGLLRDIDHQLGPHPAFGRDETTCWYDETYQSRLTEELCVGARRRADVVRLLTERYPDWELLLVVMSELHSIGHHCWHGVDPEHVAHDHPSAAAAGRNVRRTYEAVDEAVGAILRGVPDDAHVVLFSLHGTQPNSADLPSLVLLPELLYRRSGHAAAVVSPLLGEWRRSGTPVLAPRVDAGHDLAVAYGPTAMRRVRRSIEARTPVPVLERLIEVRRRLTGRGLSTDHAPVPEEATQRPLGPLHRTLSYMPPTWYQSTWPEMGAFALPTFSDGQVRINLEGRERQGRVPREDYVRFADELCEWLWLARDVRTGRRAVEDIERVRIDDPLDALAPPADLVVHWNPGVDAITHPDVGEVGPFPLLRTGEHSSRGFAYVKHPGSTGRDHGAGDSRAVTATIVDLLGADSSPFGGSLLSRIPS